MKKEYGERICLLGNVSNELLSTATPDDVQDEVKRLIDKVGPGGGYAIGSGNSVPDWARFENYMAMRNTALAHGWYANP
jgi:uroporphyrinogen decarboxylase